MKTLKLLAITIILIIVSINVFSNTIVVTTSTDSIVGSLRDAINKAQSGDTITFDKSLSEINLGWQINIGKSITISGNPGLLIHDNRWINSPEMNTTAVHRLFEICGSEVVVVNIYNLKLAKNREMVGDTVSYNTNGKIILISNNKAIVNLNLCHFLTGSRVSWGNIHPHYSPNGGILLFNGQNGGAIAQQGGKLTISNSTFSDLDAGGEIYWGAGGAICQFAGELNIFNCTFYQNSIDHSILFIGKGSAIYSQNSILSITNCSFCRQTNYYSYFLPPPQIGTSTSTTSTIVLSNSNITIKNTLFYQNDGRDLTGDNSSIFKSEGYNIFDQNISTNDGAASTDLFSNNPGFNKIGLSNNTFWIPVCALDAAGPAIDALPPDDNGAPKYDQRGHSRINSADIGAYEFEGCIPTEMKAKWNPSSFGQDSWVYDMSVVSDSVVWAKDSNADSISITTNGGASWISKPLPIPNGYLRAAGGICALSATKAYYILSTSDSKGIYVTLDGGDNWTKQSTGFNQSSLFPDIIHFWNDNEGVAIGDASPNFEIYTTSNGGVQWNQVTNANMPNGNSEGTYNNQDAFRIAGNSIFFLTGSARVFKSLDKGKTWSVVNTPFHNAIDSVITFDFKDNSNGLISYCSNDGIHHKMYKTTNGGQTWDSISTNNFYQRIKYIQTANAYFSINIKGGLSYSCDNGNTWTSVTYFDGVKLQTASFSSNDKIFFGSFGTIYWSSPILTISANALSIAPTANSIKTFNILSNTNWKVSCDKTWLKVSSTDGLGNSIITLTATANPASTARTAIVTITGKGLASQTISVTQEVPVLTVSTNTLSIAATANSTKTFDITSNIAWTAASNQSWLTLNNASGSGNATITLTATKNPTVAARAATVTVSGTSVTDQTITVTQDANTTGINEISKNPVSMFPNPVANELTINEISINATISIFDLNGKLLINRIAKSTSEKIDLSSFAKGVYLIEVADKKEIKTSKLIKQ